MTFKFKTLQSTCHSQHHNFKIIQISKNVLLETIRTMNNRFGGYRSRVVVPQIETKTLFYKNPSQQAI